MGYAQNAAPEVMVDMSVLQGLAPAADRPGATTLSRPMPRGWRPALTAPEPEPEQAPAPVAAAPAPVVKPVSKPVVTAKAAVVPPVPSRKPVIVAKKEVPSPTAPVTVKTAAAATMPEKPAPAEIAAPKQKSAQVETAKIEAPRIAATPVEKHAAKIQTFPVQMRTISESSDPALAPSIALASRNDTMLPMPEDFPEEAATPQQTAMVPPLPKRRPDVQRAPDSFVAAARAKAQIQAAKKDPSPMPALAAITKQDGPPVTAMPPGVIKAEKLAAIRIPQSDRLARQIVDPSKAELVDAIEKISSRTQEQVEKPKLHPPQIIASTPLTKEDILDITASAPARMAKADVTDITAAIEPAAGNAQGHIPRAPNVEKFEEEFVTLKFAPGVREPDEKIQSEMESGILTLLQKNPAWRVQIQAFASPDGEDVSNARRISLARALAVRTWLMDRGVEANRMDVRALGAETDRNPADRVDMVFFDPQKNG